MSGAFLCITTAPWRRLDDDERAAVDRIEPAFPLEEVVLEGELAPGSVFARAWARPSGLGSRIASSQDGVAFELGVLRGRDRDTGSAMRSDGRRAQVWADDRGYRTVYVWQGDGIAAASTRPELLAEVARATNHRLSRDPLIAVELSYIGWLGPERTGWSEVRALRSATHALLTKGVVSVESDPDAAGWVDPPRVTREIGDVVADASDALCQIVETVLATDAELYVDLTAGRDSRMLLAALSNLGALGDVTFQTIGGPAIHDVRVAASTASSIGADHRSGFFYPISDDELGVRFKRHVGLTAGVSNVWLGIREHLPWVDGIRVQGQMGELARGWPTPVRRDSTARDLLDLFLESHHAGGLDLLHPAAAAAARELVSNEMLFGSFGEMAGRFAVHRYHSDVRLRARLTSVDDFTPEVRSYPLYARDFVAFGLELMWSHPGADFAELLTERLAPGLDDVVALAEASATPPEPSQSSGVPTDVPDKASFMTVATSRQTVDRQSIIEALVDVDSAAWESIDREKLQEAVAGYSILTRPQLRLLHGAAGAVLWLAGGNDE